MIHLYCGDGKGKTTCAFGLALRAAGRGKGVVAAQFLKTEDSGERLALAQVPNVCLLPLPREMKFTFAMSEAEKAQAAAGSLALLAAVEQALAAGSDLAVLDECCAAVSTGLLPLEGVTALLDRWGAEKEIVLTGRDPDPALANRAHYITEMRKIKHPFDVGEAARKGIEW